MANDCLNGHSPPLALCLRSSIVHVSRAVTLLLPILHAGADRLPQILDDNLQKVNTLRRTTAQFGTLGDFVKLVRPTNSTMHSCSNHCPLALGIVATRTRMLINISLILMSMHTNVLINCGWWQLRLTAC